MRSVLFSICLAFLGCRSSSSLVFRGGALPETWKRVEAESDLAYRSELGASIYANVECRQIEDAPLDVLTDHLLFGIDVKEEHRREITLAGRKALRTLVDGELDGVPIRLDTVVMKKDGCTYDLALITGPETFAQHELDFDRFVAGFETMDLNREEERKEEGWACSVVPC